MTLGKSARPLVVAGLPTAVASRQLAHRLETALLFIPLLLLLSADGRPLRISQPHIAVTLRANPDCAADNRTSDN